MDDPPTECLRLFDQFELENHRECRLATYTLEDYYGSVLSEVGEEYLGFTPNDSGRGIGVQWNEAKRRLNSINLTEIPDTYNDIIHRLGDERDSVAHGYQHRPRKRRLIEAREIAEEWANWFSEQAKDYHEQEGDLTVRETLYNLILDSLESALIDPATYDQLELRNQQNDINHKIFSLVYYNPAITFEDVDMDEIFEEELQEYGYELVKIDNTVPSQIGFNSARGHVDMTDLAKDDIFLYRRALNLANKVDDLREKAKSIEYRDAMMTPDSTRCVVVEPYDEDTGEIHLLDPHSDDHGEHIWQDVHELPDHLRQELQNKEEDEIVEAVFGVNQFGDRCIKDLPRVS